MKFIAIDIETTGLYPTPGSKIYCVAINDGSTISIATDPMTLKTVLEDKNVVKVIHNAGFDSFWLAMLYNIRVTNIWDTRLMEQVIIGENLSRSVKDEEIKKQLSSSLLYTLERYGLATLDKTLGAKFAIRNRFAPLTPAEIEYAKNDVRYLLQLQAMQERRLVKLDLMRVANLENRLVEVVVSMRKNGIGLDIDKWLSIAKVNETAYNSILKRLPPAVSNWNSPKQVKKFFNAQGIAVDSLTGIEDLVHVYNNPALTAFVELRKYYKLVTTYGKSWLNNDIKINTVDHDNRVRCDYEQMVNSGRLSSSNPNLQQLPRDGELRSAFVPAKGNVFVIGDFGGQEIGIMAAASKEEIWIKAMLHREDIHSLTASLLYPAEWVNGAEKGCTFPKKCKCVEHNRVRQNAKTINFAIAYGAGNENIARQLGISTKQASKLLTKYKRVVPKLTRWLAENSKETKKTRLSFSADPFRRRRVLREPQEFMLANIGKNNPLQSSGANMIKLAMVSLNKDTQIVLTVHDEIILEVKKGKAKQAVKELKAIMEKSADYCTEVPGLIEAEPRIANNLAKI